MSADDGARRAVGDHAPRGDYDDAIGCGLDVGDDMRGEQHDPVLREACEQIAKPHALLGIETNGRLIDDEELRIAEQRLGDCDALPVAAGERAERPFCDRHEIECVAGARCAHRSL